MINSPGYPSFIFLLVCYYNEQEISSFVRNELARQTCSDYLVIVADNGTKDKSVLDNLKTSDSRVTIVDCHENKGYFGGAALAFNEYKKDILPPYVILCNTDISFDNTSFLEDLLNQKYHDTLHIIGPDIYSDRFSLHQNPYIPKRIKKRKIQTLKFFTSFQALYNMFLLVYYFLNLLFPRRKENNILNASKKSEVYSVHGSFIIFTRNFFKSGGSLNYGSFLFGEEIFIGEVAKKYGMKILYDPQLKVIHREHSTTGLFKSTTSVKYLHQSYSYILNMYY